MRAQMALIVALALIGTATAVPGVSIIGTEAGTAYTLTNEAAFKLGYIDSASTGTFGSLDASEAVILDVDGDGFVDAGDVVLRAGLAPYTTVGSFTTATGHALKSTTGANTLLSLLAFEDLAPTWENGGPNGKLGPGDKLFIDVDNSDDVTAGDIQLHKVSGAFGTNYVASANADTNFDVNRETLCITQGGGDVAILNGPCVGVTNTVTNVRYLDNVNANGVWDATEKVFFADGAAPTTVKTGVREISAGTPISCHEDEKNVALCGLALTAGTFKINSKPVLAVAALKLVSSINEFFGGVNTKSYYFIDGAMPVHATGNLLSLDSTNTPGDWTSVGAQFPALLTNFGTTPKVFITSDLTAAIDGDEVVALNLDGNLLIGQGDFILANKAIGAQTSCTPLTQLDATHACATAAWTQLVNANFGFTNADGDGAHDKGDALYLINDATTLKVATWDTRIVRNDAFGVARVLAGDSDNADTIIVHPSGLDLLKYLDKDGTGTYTIGDAIYLDLDADNIVTPQDVRLFGAPVTGNIVLPGATDSMTKILDTSGTGPGTPLGDGEILHLYNSGTRVVTFRATSAGAAIPASGDIRVLPWASGQSAGSVIQAGDPEFGYGTTGAAAAKLCYVDHNANSLYDSKDSVYVTLGKATCGTVNSFDLLVSLSGAGKMGVAAGTQLPGNGLALPATMDVTFFDENADTLRGLDEKIYLDIDNNGLLSPGDILMKDVGGITTPTSSTTAPPPASTSTSTATSSSASTSSSSSASSSTTSSTSSTASSSTASSSSSSSAMSSTSSSVSESSTDGEVKTPPIGFLAMIGALAAIVIARRK